MVKLFLPVPHPVWKMIPKRNMFSNLFHKIQSILARVNPNVFVSSTWFRWSWVETTQDDFTRLAIFSGSKVATSSPNQSFRTKLTENIRKYQPTFNQPWFREIQESLRPYIKTIENTVFFFSLIVPSPKIPPGRGDASPVPRHQRWCWGLGHRLRHGQTIPHEWHNWRFGTGYSMVQQTVSQFFEKAVTFFKTIYLAPKKLIRFQVDLSCDPEILGSVISLENKSTWAIWAIWARVFSESGRQVRCP